LAIPSDATAISALITGLAKFFTVDANGVGAEGFMASLEPASIEKLICAPNFKYYAGLTNSEIVGVVAIRDNTHLFHLFVSERLQGNGIGKLLWKNARDAAIAAGNPGRFTINSTVFGVPIYESFGFKATGPKTETNGIAFIPMRYEQTDSTYLSA
jgi:GNAT superfamily N-acetyltransferase